MSDAGAEPVEAPITVRPPARFTVATVVSVSVDLPNQFPVVVLRESDAPRRQLSFTVGFQDGAALAHALKQVPAPRPLTHELTSGILHSHDIDVVAARLVGRTGQIYFAELDLRGRSQRSVHACRPSDALTICLLEPVPAPILIDIRLFDQMGDVAPPSA